MFKCKPNLMDICHTLLNSGLSVLYQKIVLEIENLYKDRTDDILEVCLNFEEAKLEKEVIDSLQPVNKAEILFNFKNNKAEIKFPYNFFRNFNTPENKGEKEIIRNIAISLICLYEKKEKQIRKETLDILINKVITKNMRILHIFNTDLLYEFAQKRATNFEWTYADEIFTRAKILKKVSNEESGTILKSKDAQVFLNTLFENIFLHIKSRLKLFDRKSLIYKLIEIYESELHKNEHWNKTIGAVISLYEDGNKIAELKNRDRDAIKKSTQILLEIAICECPENADKRVSNWDIDELLAEILLLIEVATDSDILKNNLCVPEIKIENNGEYTIDRNFLQTLIRPYVRDSTFLIYKQKTQKYKELYESYQTDGNELPQINENFILEFGLSIKDLSKICNSLFKIAIKKDSLVVETTIDEIEKRCKEDGLSCKAVKSFIDSFTIFHRPNWENPPDGFTTKDIFPSKYNRRLSFNVRPLLVFSKSDAGRVFYGIKNVYMAMNYLLYQIKEGNFPIEFFKSKQMKSLCGEINNKKGDEFNKKVADKLKRLKWNIKLNLKMSELEASNEFGDIDILAWKNHQIKIIESKRLRPVRNTNEIVNSLKRFKGENNDLLQKHSNRVKWVKNNLNSLKRIVKFVPNLDHINGVIVTNILIPSQYVDYLSIDFDSIITIDDLENKL